MLVRVAVFATVLVMSTAGASAWAVPVIGDASFESPSENAFSKSNHYYVYNITGTPWTFANSSGITSNGGPFYAGSAPDGVQTAFLQSNSGNGTSTISQIISGFDVGSRYTVSFYIASRPGSYFGSTPVDVTLGGVDLGSFTNSSTDFVLETSQFYQATDTSALLTFTATNTTGIDNDVALDAVSIPQVVSTAVPEPATLPLLGFSAAAVLVGRHRRKG